MNGESQLRDLEVWQPEDDCVGGGIEDDMNSNSWTPEEMFAKVKERKCNLGNRKYKVSDPDLDYLIQLETSKPGNKSSNPEI